MSESGQVSNAGKQPTQTGPRNMQAPSGQRMQQDGGPFNPAFDKKLMRRRWSQKEIVTAVAEELVRNGKLSQAIEAKVLDTIKKHA